MRAITVFVIAAALTSGCGGCSDETNAITPDAGMTVDIGSSDAETDTGETTDDTGVDGGMVQRPTSPVVLPVSGGGDSSSSQHKLRMRIGQPAGNADRSDRQLKLGGNPQ